jgi:hypothetical protein
MYICMKRTCMYIQFKYRYTGVKHFSLTQEYTLGGSRQRLMSMTLDHVKITDVLT